MGPTESDHVGDSTHDTKAEAAFLNLLTAAEDQRDSDRAGVAHSQENDTDTRKCVVGSTGTEVDGTQANFNHHAQHQCIQRDVEALIDDAPPTRSRNTPIPGKGPGASGGGRHAAYTADHTENQQGYGQAESTSVVANSGFENDRRRLVRVDQHGQFGHDEAEGNEEEETGDGVDDNGTDHGFGDHDSRLAYFFTETVFVSAKSIQERSAVDLRDDHARGRSSVGSLEKTDEEGPPRWPASLWLEISKDPGARVPAILCDRQETDNDGNQARHCPEDSKSLLKQS